MQVYPNGVFEFISEGEKVKGRFCMWTFDRFCTKMEIPNVSELIKVLTDGVSLRAIAEMLLSSVEYYYNKEGKDFPHSYMNACDWIDEIGLKTVTKLIGDAMIAAYSEEKSGEKKRTTKK